MHGTNRLDNWGFLGRENRIKILNKNQYVEKPLSFVVRVCWGGGEYEKDTLAT